jgi:hypothetical protein
MFLTSRVHHHKDCIVRTCSFFYGMFFLHLCKQSSSWEDVLDLFIYLFISHLLLTLASLFPILFPAFIVDSINSCGASNKEVPEHRLVET